jgi:hypothetical protein
MKYVDEFRDPADGRLPTLPQLSVSAQESRCRVIDRPVGDPFPRIG